MRRGRRDTIAGMTLEGWLAIAILVIAVVLLVTKWREVVDGPAVNSAFAIEVAGINPNDESSLLIRR